MKLLSFITAAVSILLLTGAAHSTRPSITDCGSALPPDALYSININAVWDTSTQPPTSDISITLRDEAKNETPYEIPGEAEAFATCIQSALGVG